MKIQKKIALLLVFTLLVTIAIMGCNGKEAVPGQKENNDEDVQEEMLTVLPNRTGFRFIYNGFAEYGHELELVTIEKGKDKTVFKLTGSVDDPSNGESNDDLSLNVIYTIKNGILYQTVKGKMMDSISEMEILHSPLKTGTRWEQSVQNKEGEKIKLECVIAEIKESEGKKVYTVNYKDKESDFYEKRIIQEGVGVISFETMKKSKEDLYTIGYSLYKEKSGFLEKTKLNAFLPPLAKPLRYFGLAEYAHTGTLTAISENEESAEYQFKGIFQDGSGIPGEFIIQYLLDFKEGTVQEKVISNTREKFNEVNSKLHDPILIKLPLQVDNTWQQEISFDGEKKTMTAKIVSIAYEGRTFYSQRKQKSPVMTVRYVVEDVPGYFENTYVEERRFEKGKGMIGFSQITKGDIDIAEKDSEYNIENYIINNMFGYSLAQE